MLAFTARRRWQLSFTRPLSQKLQTRSTHSTDLASIPSHNPDSLPSPNPASRVVRVLGLPLNYDVSTVVRAIVGNSPVERVSPHPDHIILTCYYWRQAQAFSKKPIQLDDKEFRVDWVASRRGGGEDFGPISTGAVARLGYLRASRSLCVYFEDEPDEDDMLKHTGELESMVPFLTEGNVHGFDITFLSAEACSRFYDKCMRGEMPGFPSDSVHFLDRKELGYAKDILRWVKIQRLKPKVALSPYLREHVEEWFSTLFQAGPGRFRGERVTAIHQTPDFISIKFVSASDAHHFVDNFPAATFGAQMVLEKTNPFNPNLSLAIQSGAGRALTISLPHSMSLSVEELTRDFSQFRGLVNVTISADHIILRYQSVLKALRTVCALEAGTHRLPDKYIGGRVSFLPMRGAPQTLPVTISEGYDSENWKMASRWVEKRWKPPAVVVNRKSIWKIRRKRWVPPADLPGVD